MHSAQTTNLERPRTAHTLALRPQCRPGAFRNTKEKAISAMQPVNGTGLPITPAEIISPTAPLPASRVEAVEASFFEKAVCLTLSIGRFGNTRKAPLTSVQVQANKSRLRLSKQLLVSPALDKIESYDNGLRSWVQSRCLPMPGVFRGSYLLLLEAIEEVNARLGKAEKIERRS